MKYILPLLLLWQMLATSFANVNTVYTHRQANIFPVTGVNVDGDLGDWQPAMFVQMYADEQLQDVYALRIAFGYDEQGVLVAGEVTDTTPLVNHTDPAIAPDSGWNGDALQLRFGHDAEFIHCTAWYFTDGKLPAMDTRYGMNYQNPVTRKGDASGWVYRQRERGYTVEGRIPWELLKGQAAPGATWQMTLQMLFSDAKGNAGHNFFDLIAEAGFHYQRPDAWGSAYFVKPAELAAKLAAQTAAETALFQKKKPTTTTGIAVHYKNPEKGFVGLAIAKPTGEIVRTLLAKVERDAGAQVEMWDGLDDDGRPVPAGAYRLKALTHPGIKPKFVVSVHNAGTPPWKTPDGTGAWGADHGVPLAAAHDEHGHTYLLWHVCEAADAMIAVDASGRKLWGNRMGWDSTLGGLQTALAYADGVLYVGRSGYSESERSGKRLRPKYTDGFVAFDAKTGRRIELPGGGHKVVSEWPPALGEKLDALGTATERLHGGRFPAGFANAHDDVANLVALTATPDRLYAALHLEDKIVAFDRQTLEQKETIPLPKPAGLAFDAQRNVLYAVSDQTVVAIESDQPPRPFVTGLEFPTGLALDADGTLYVAVRGKQMQVRVFDVVGTDRRAVRDDGAPGGRALPRLIRRIGKDGGRAWVGKYDPRGLLMPAGITVDARGQLWITEADDRPKRVSVWDAKTGKFLREYFGASAYAVMSAPNPEKFEEVYVHNVRWIVDYAKGTARPDATVWRDHWTAPTLNGPIASNGSTWRMSAYRGRKLAYNARCGLFLGEGHVFKPFFYAGHWTFPGEAPTGDEPAGPVSFYWRDQNGDGLVQPEEITRYPGRNLSNTNVGYFGGDMFPGGVFILGQYCSRDRFILRPSGIGSDGLPVYPPPSELEPIFLGNGPMTRLPFQAMIHPSFSPAHGDYEIFYGLAGVTEAGPGEGLYKFDRQGNILWRYARVALGFGLKAPLARAGDLFGALRITGVAQLSRANGGEIIGVGSYRGYHALLNEDGLFIDQIGYDGGRGPTPAFDTFFIENFSGALFKHPRTGKVYLFAGDTDARILELQGLDKIHRFDAGQLAVTTAQQQQALLASTTGGDASTDRTLRVKRGATNDTWTTIPLDETHAARVALAYDETNLYATFEVADDSPWRNDLKDWRTLFKTGDAVDIHLGILNPEPAGTKRKPQRGDVRVLIAPAPGDGLTVVGMWSRTPEGLAAEPYEYQSPTGKEAFERVAQLPGVTGRVTRQDQSYRIEVTLPWQELHLPAPPPNSLRQGDVGVLVSDTAGTRTALRRYLFNQDTAITFDVPSEVRVNCANWGTIHFE